ncbi:MAG: VCBS repeat-containing protein [Lentisphaerae bacterium]|nr:VCBS repeat-containing protein [Lentisphaerota bacterium]
MSDKQKAQITIIRYLRQGRAEPGIVTLTGERYKMKKHLFFAVLTLLAFHRIMPIDANASETPQAFVDRVAPLIYIEEPTSEPTYSTSKSVLSVSGVAYQHQGIINSIQWQNSKGGFGEAIWDAAKNAWNIAAINLSVGENKIDITATGSGGTSKASLTVTYYPSVEPFAKNVANDFNGDGKADLAVYDPNNAHWYIASLTGEQIALANHWGFAGPVASYRNCGNGKSYLVPGDYNGDGKTDIAIFNKTASSTADDGWYAKTTDGRVLAWNIRWSSDSAIPVPGDYDGDGKTDIAVYDLATGIWYVQTSQGEEFALAFGWAEALPVQGDYDGDGRTDFGVYHPATGNWYIWTWRGAYYITQFGWAEAEPVPADYSGDGKTDFAVYHQAEGMWHVLGHDGYKVVQFGWAETVPVPADYNGDGRADIAVYHQATGDWYIWPWFGNFLKLNWGWSETVTVRASW